MLVRLTEEERQLILLALAHLAVERPGWCDCLSRLSQQLEGEVMFQEFYTLRAQGPPQGPVPPPPEDTP